MANKQIKYDIGFNVDRSGIQEIKQSLTDIQRMSISEFKLSTGNSSQTTLELRNKLTEIQEEARKVESALNSSFNPKLNTINLTQFQNKINEMGMSITSIGDKFSQAGSKGQIAFSNLTRSLLTTKRETRETFNVLNKIGETFANTIKWSIASGAINTVTSAIRNAWGYSVKLDTSLNDIRIVTEKSSKDMEKFAVQANKAAKALGTQTTAYTKASLIYYQQGLGEEDVEARTNVTIKAANVTGQSTAEVSEQLTAVWNGYKVAADEAEKYVDKLAAVAANTAVDLEEISTGMSKVSSAANAMGVNIDQLTAQIATIGSVTRQDTSVVGTALKTIFARLGDLQVDGVDEFGTKLGDVSGKMRQMGIEVLDQEGNLRDMGSVIEEVASKWDTWTSAQQQAAAVAMAGKRQYNNLIALFENWDMYESALTTSKNSEGTLQRQQDIYMESTEAKLKGLAASGEAIYKALFDSDSMREMLGAVISVTDAVGEFIKLIGGGGNLLLMLGGVAGKVLGNQIGGFVSKLAVNYQHLRFNQEQYKAELEITEALARSQGIKNEENLKKLLELKRQQLELEKNLTDEQKKQNAEALDNIAHAMVEKENAVVNMNDANEAFQFLQGTKDTNKKTRKTISFEEFDAISTIDLEAQEEVDKNTEEVKQKTKLLNQTDSIKKALTAEKEEIKLTSPKTEEEEIKKAERLVEIEKELLEITEKAGLQEAELLDVQKKQEESLERQKRIKENKISADEAISMLKTGSDYSSQLSQDSSELKNILNYQQEKFSYEKEFGGVDSGANLGTIKERLEKEKKEIQKAEKNGEKIEGKSSKEISEQIKALNKLIAAEEKAGNVKKHSAEKTKKLLESLKDTTTGTDKFSKVTQQASNKIIELNKRGLTELLNKEELTEEETKQLTGLLEELEVATKGSAEAFDDCQQQLQENTDALKVINDQIKTQQQQMQEDQAAQRIQQITSTVVTLAGYAGQILGTVTSIVSSVSQIWSDEQLTGAEKMKKTIAAIIPIFISLIPMIFTLKTEINSLIVGIKGVGGAAEKAGIQGFLAGIKAQSGFFPLLIITAVLLTSLLALLAVFTAISAIQKAMGDNGKKAFEEASKGAYSMSKELERTKKAAEELKQTFEQYDSAQKAIEDLTTGTQEWRDAVRDVNTQVLDLMEKYPELVKYVSNKNGQLVISEEGKEKALENAEDAVLMTSFSNSYAQAEKLKAKNNMIIETAAEEVKKDGGGLGQKRAGEGAALGAATGAAVTAAAVSFFPPLMAVLSPLGAALGAGIGATVGAIEGSIESDKKRDEAYEKAIELINTHGNAILDSEEKFAEALGEDYAYLADELLAERTQLEKNALAIEANTEALKFYKKQGAYDYLLANSEVFKKTSEEDKNLLAAIFAKQVEDSDVSLEKKKQENWYVKADGTIRDGDKRRDALAKDYAEEIGKFDYDNYKIEDNKIIYLNEKGETIAEIEGSAAAKAIENKAKKDILIDNIDDYLNSLNEVENVLSKSLGKNSVDALMQLAGGEKSTDLSSLTSAEIEALKTQKALLSFDGNALKDFGFKEDEIKAAFDASISNYEEEEKKVTKDLFASVVNVYNELENLTQNWSLATKKSVAKSLEEAFLRGGATARNSLKDLYSDLGEILSTDDLGKVASVASTIDWTSGDAMLKFEAALSDMGIDLGKIKDPLTNFANKISESSTFIKELTTNFDGLIDRIQNFSKLTQDLSIGKIISKEDYENLTSYNSALKDFFILTAEGYKYIGGADAELNEVFTAAFDMNKAKKQYDEVYSEAERLSKEGMNLEASTLEEQSKILKGLFGSAIFSVSEYSEDAIKESLDSLNDTVLVEGKSYTYAQLAEMSADDFKNAKDSQNVNNQLSEARRRKNNVSEIASSAYSAIANKVMSYEDGTIDKDLDDALTLIASAQAKNYDDLKALRDQMTENAFNKLAKVYLAEEADQLGISAKAWETLTETSLEYQESILDRRKLLKSYDEINFYYEYERAAEDTNRALESLADAQETLFGDAAIENLEKQVNLQKTLLSNAEAQYEVRKKEIELRKADLNDVYSNSLAQYGITLNYENDGTIDVETYNKIRDLLSQDLADDERTYVETLLKDIETYNDKLLDGLNEYASAMKNAFDAMADAALEIFDKKLTIVLDFREFSAQIENFKKEFSDILKEGISFFGEETAADAYRTALGDYNLAKGQITSVMTSLKDRKAAFERAEELTAQSNQYYEDLDQQAKNLDAQIAAQRGRVNNASSVMGSTKQYDYFTPEVSKEDKSRLNSAKRKAEMAVYYALQRKYGSTSVSTVKDFISENSKQREQVWIDLQQVFEGTTDYGILEDRYNKLNKAYEAINPETKEIERDEYVTAKNAYNKELNKLNELQAQKEALDYSKFAYMEELQKDIQNTTDYAYATIDMETGRITTNTAQYFEDIKNNWEEFNSYYEQLKDNISAMYESFSQAQEEILEAYDREIEKRSTLNSLYSSAASLYQLVGNKSSGYAEKLIGYYKAMTDASRSNYEIAQEQYAQMLDQYNQTKAAFEAGEASQEMLDMVETNLATSLENLLTTEKEFTDNMVAQLSSSLSAIADEFIASSNELSLGLSEMQEEWSRAVDLDERYLDEVNASYALGELERKYNKSIDETDNYSAQKKLNKAMEEQLKMLREKDKLSQYDIDRANAMYELTLKQIALEEARNTATKMKLTRDASGNYSYQYVADQNAIADAEAEVAAAENELYNLDKDRRKDLIDEYFSLQSEASEAIANASESNREKVVDYYKTIIQEIQDELGISADLGLPFEDFATSIQNINSEEMFNQISALVDEAKGLEQIIESSFGENSSFTQGINILGGSVKNIESIDASIADQVAVTKNVLDNLSSMISRFDELNEALNIYSDVLDKTNESSTDLQQLEQLMSINANTKVTADALSSGNGNNPTDSSNGIITIDGNNT